jgi:hypothetical protein
MTLPLLGLLIVRWATRLKNLRRQSNRAADRPSEKRGTSQLVARRMARGWWKSPPLYDPAWRDGIEAKPF